MLSMSTHHSARPLLQKSSELGGQPGATAALRSYPSAAPETPYLLLGPLAIRNPDREIVMLPETQESCVHGQPLMRVLRVTSPLIWDRYVWRMREMRRPTELCSCSRIEHTQLILRVMYLI